MLPLAYSCFPALRRAKQLRYLLDEAEQSVARADVELQMVYTRLVVR